MYVKKKKMLHELHDDTSPPLWCQLNTLYQLALCFFVPFFKKNQSQSIHPFSFFVIWVIDPLWFLKHHMLFCVFLMALHIDDCIYVDQKMGINEYKLNCKLHSMIAHILFLYFSCKFPSNQNVTKYFRKSSKKTKFLQKYCQKNS